MALVEQDSGPFGSIPPEEGGALAPPDASAPLTDSFDPVADDADPGVDDAAAEQPHESEVPPRASRRPRRGGRGKQGSPARLAAAVANLRDLEDTISSHVRSADQIIARLESRGVHTDAGYASHLDFEQRILASTPLVKAMRDLLATPTPQRTRNAAAKGRPLPARTRRTKALGAMAEALAKLRNLDVAIHQATLAARDALAAIDSQRLFDECGYLSFEEFLERALGPSPVLGAAVSLAEMEVAQPAEAEAVEEDELIDEDTDEGTHGAALAFSELSPSEPQILVAAPEAHPAPAAVVAAPARTRSFPKELAASLILCLAATFGGGAAGSWTVLRALAHVDTQSTTAHAEETPAAKEHAATPAKAAPSGAPVEKKTVHAPETVSAPVHVHAPEAAASPVDAATAKSASATAHEDLAKSAATPKAEPYPWALIPVSPPRTRPAGPREARR